jgi:hypothetical protein
LETIDSGRRLSRRVLNLLSVGLRSIHRHQMKLMRVVWVSELDRLTNIDTRALPEIKP